jgi:hypothetical protein
MIRLVYTIKDSVIAGGILHTVGIYKFYVLKDLWEIPSPCGEARIFVLKKGAQSPKIYSAPLYFLFGSYPS